MILRWFFFMVLTVFMVPALAFNGPVVPLSAGEKLRRLSLTLRGLEPSTADLRWIESLSTPQQVRAFLESSAKSYANSEEFTAKVVERFSEVSRWPQTPFAPEWVWNSGLLESLSSLDSTKDVISTTHNLLRSVVRQNRPWDQLLLSKVYVLPKGNDPVSRLSAEDRTALEDYIKKEDFSPSSKVDSEVPRADKTVVVAANDHRFSGFLSLSTFLTATPVNSDKVSFYKRAAAILRIFHCEDLRPANIATSTTSISDELSLDADMAAGALQPEMKNKKITSETNPNQVPAGHASNIQCRVCHDKLDPISNLYKEAPRSDSYASYTFRQEAKKIPEPKTSVLLFADGKRVPVKGIAGLAQALSQSPEFSRCQSERLAKWFSPGKSFFSQQEKIL
ncbi:MAG: hypothetical protein K2X47_00310, partial [Bdellovibrionales bacterium]|nr:hypothetical protein [Bdellovibrionales bacterium]